MQPPLWVTGPSHKVLRNEKPDFNATAWIYDSANRLVKLQAVTVESFTLEGPGGAKIEHIEMFREHYLPHEDQSGSA